MNTIEQTLAGIFLILMCSVLGYGTKLYLEGNTLQTYNSILLKKEATCTFDVANIPVSCRDTKLIIKLVDYPNIDPIRITVPDSHHESWMTLNTSMPPTTIEWYVSGQYSELKKLYAFCSMFTLTFILGLSFVAFLQLGVPYLIKRRAVNSVS